MASLRLVAPTLGALPGGEVTAARWEEIRCCNAEEVGEGRRAGRGEVSRKTPVQIRDFCHVLVSK